MTDPKDPRVTSTDGHDPDAGPSPAPGPINPATGQHTSYWVLTEEERAKGFVRPLRDAYVHTECGTVTRMGHAIAETYARQPSFYGSTFCVACKAHFPVGEFEWDKEPGAVVGS
jgi:hypothetical protein